MLFQWLVFALFCVLFTVDLGLPKGVGWAAQGTLLFVLLLVILGVLTKASC